MTTIDTTTITTPLGTVHAAVQDGRLVALGFEEYWPTLRQRLERRFGALTFRANGDAGGIGKRLARYFAGDLDAIEDVTVDPGGTPFQQKVWRQLRNVKVGRTASYGEVARAIGSPAAVRAVGLANGQNPCWLVIPCHRIIGSNGSLTGYGGGLDRKRWLLKHEGALLS
jgi:methylated-DNA-[protein]-cysteine S-methyltransferase